MTESKSTKCWVLTYPEDGTPNPNYIAKTRKELINKFLLESYSIEPKDKAARKKAWKRVKRSIPLMKARRARIMLADKEDNLWFGESTDEIIPDSELKGYSGPNNRISGNRRPDVLDALLNALRQHSVPLYQIKLLEDFDLALWNGVHWLLTKKGKAYLYAALDEKMENWS